MSQSAPVTLSEADKEKKRKQDVAHILAHLEAIKAGK